MNPRSFKSYRCFDGTYFSQIEHKGVVLRQWGLSQEESFENLMEVVQAIREGGEHENH